MERSLQQDFPEAEMREALMDQQKSEQKVKVGLIVNSGQIVTEPLYYAIAGDQCDFFTTRLFNPGGGDRGILEMSTSLPRAVRELASAKVDIIVSCCAASGILHGYASEQALCRDVEQETGIPMVTTMLSVVAALRYVKAASITFIAPYSDATNAMAVSYLALNGIEAASAVSATSLEAGGLTKERVGPEEIAKFSLEHWNPGSDALLLSCMNWQALRVADRIEKTIKRPVITTHGATLWNALRVAGKNASWPVCGGTNL
jgi:maleate cis-trans isomerase